jgi:transposase InsO family protein
MTFEEVGQECGELLMDEVVRRRRWIVRRKLEGWKIDRIAEALQVSEKTVDRWCGIHRKYGWEGLRIKSKAPHNYWETPLETVELILKLRRERCWGPCKIEGYLKNYAKKEGPVIVGHTTIHKLLIEAGLNNPITAPRKTWGKHRFQRPYSNNLWQSDFKMTEADEWMISYLDDHSRYVPGSEIHHTPTGEHAIQLLEDCIHEHGKPDQILTDQGTQYHPARGNLSAFTEFCNGNGIEHITASKRRPSTIGKIEAFHKAYDREAWMFKTHQEFIQYWNYQRPHQGIGYLYPADIYFRDLKKGTHVGG